MSRTPLISPCFHPRRPHHTPWCGEETRRKLPSPHLVPGCYIWWPGFCSCLPRGHPLITDWKHAWIPWDYNHGETVTGRFPPHGTAQTAHWTHVQSWERDWFACPGALAWGADLQFGTLLGAHRRTLRQWRSVDAVFVFSLCLIPVHRYLPERHLFPCLAPWLLQLLPGDTSTSPGSAAQWGFRSQLPQTCNQQLKKS